nr:TonB-dependent receptor [Pseudoalteromonas rubra]
MTKGPMMKRSVLAMAVALAAPQVLANSDANNDDMEHIQILSHYDKLRTEAGSATLLTEEQLAEFEYDDIHRILASVPGVNIREEDGYGLRPNIGFRGVTPERSKKITIMEDGVLIGPAPYSAPAAYYFPVTTRMTAVEVFKGPAAIKHGPQSVAGALNLVTRAVPEFSEGSIDLAMGSDGYTKAHAYFGSVVNNVGFLLEGVNLQADGFKDLDGGADTGFEKNDLLAKFNYKLQQGEFEHTFGLKLSYADELSNETYLGLTDADFDATPYRRYAASQPDNMDTKHSQVMFSHHLKYQDVSLTSRVYRNDYERAWLKLDGLTNTDATLPEILANPEDEQYQRLYQVISGTADSIADSGRPNYLSMGTNDREYFSQGIQVDGSAKFKLAGYDNTLSFGVRFHEDEIERKHFNETYGMRDGSAFNLGLDKVYTSQNTENTKAWSVYLEDKVTIDALTLGLGIRGELMDMAYQSTVNADDWQDKTTRIWLPGMSGFYQLSEDSGILFGVHQGFSPASPQQSVDIEIEKSTNYEFGGRFNDGVTQLEVVSFFNDYSNLKESCGQSNCGALEVGKEFNGGEAHVYGLEAQFSQRYPLNLQIDIPYGFVYTYTKGEFKNDRYTNFAQWGHVKSGDELPYLPEHQASFNIGLSAPDWRVSLAVKYVGSMSEAAGRSWDSSTDSNAPNGSYDLVLEGKEVSAITTVDLSAVYELGKYGQVYAKVDNLLDETKIVSRRPYGARPGKPRQFTLGYKYSF